MIALQSSRLPVAMYWLTLRHEMRANWAKFAYLMTLIGVIWWRMAAGVMAEKPPLLTWMIMAETAVLVMAVLSQQRFAELLKERRSETNRTALGGNAFMLLQLYAIIVGNTVVVGFLLVMFPGWKLGDTVNLLIGGSGMVVFLLLALLRNVLKPREGTWLQALGWRLPWAKCWYVLNLKALPQFVTAYSIYFLGSSMDLVAAGALLLLGGSRLDDANLMRRADRRSSVSKALWVGAVFDFASMLLIVVALAIVSWR